MEHLLATSLGYAARGTITGICTVGDYLVNGTHPHIAERIEALDIVNKVRIVDAYLEQLSGRSKKADDARPFNKAVHVAVRGVHDVMERVHSLLEGIKTECDLHTERYFHYWRTPNCLEQLDTLEKQAGVLDQRLTLTMQIVAQSQWTS